MILELYKFLQDTNEHRQQFYTNKQNWKFYKMRLINIIQLNNSGAKKRSLFGRSLSSILLLQSFLRSRKPAKKAVLHRLEKKPCSTAFLCFKTPHVLYPTFGVATLSARQTCKKNAGQPYSHRHTDFQRLLNCPAIKFKRNVPPKKRD